jgi:glycosyltransferase involved in cell wall biosynthesis
MESVTVSVIIPVYNEARYITICIESLLKQDYAFKEMEWIFVDGLSQDTTVSLIQGYKERYPDLIRLYENPYRIVSHAMNIGISHSKGKYIVRLDAHAEFSMNYISRLVYYLDVTDADNVGGLARTKGNGFMGETIAMLLSSRFGVGNSRFRTNGESGYVDTVPFGAFRREVFEKLGGYDPRLVRNQDNEMNYRIRKNGGLLYLASDITFSYYCRDSVSGILKMGILNGKWNIYTEKICPHTMGLRHFVPFLFVLSLVLMPCILFFWTPIIYFMILELFLYLMLDVHYSFKARKKSINGCVLVFLFPLFHISYGLGSLIGIMLLLFKTQTRVLCRTVLGNQK